MSTEPVTSLRPPAWDVVDWTAHWERLSGELGKLEAEKVRVASELAVLMSERTKLSAAVASLQTRETRLTASIDKLSTDADANKAYASSVAQALEELRRQRDDLLEDITLWKTERDALRSEAEHIRAELDTRSAELDVRHAVAIEREAALEARQAELDARAAASETERIAERMQFLRDRDLLAVREKSLVEAEKKVEDGKKWNGCFATFFAPFLIVLGALIGGVVVAGLILL